MKVPFRSRVARLVSAVVVLISITATPILAQENQQSGNGFRISPVRSEYTIEKGKSVDLPITIENPANVPTNASLVANDFIASDKEDGEPRLILDDTGERPKNSFKSLVGDLGTVELGPSEKKDITVKILIPEDANAGGYYGAIRVVPATGGAGSANVGLTASVGSIVLIRVPGPLTERLDLVEFTTSQNNKAKSFFTSGDVSVMLRLKNEGDIHLKPIGKVQIKDTFGKQVHEYELNSDQNTAERSNILPGSIRRFEDTIPNKKFLGRYTVTVNLGYSEGGGELISAETTFWYLPIWSIAVLLLLLSAIVFGAIILYKRFSVPGSRHGVKKK